MTALITGATAGIGKATAQIFAEQGFNLIITGRRAERLAELKAELEQKFNTKILVLCFDVRDKISVENAIKSLPENWQNIDILINNAGLAVGLNHVQDGEIDDWERMIDTNIKGLLYVTRTVSPLMIARGGGHIVNICSIAGKEVYENGNVYCATKHAVDALSKAMRVDMLKHNIRVTNICPGAVETEFSLVRFKNDAERAKQPYIGIEPLTAEDIAKTIFFVISQPKHVCINDLTIMPTAQANGSTFYRM
ncbi:MAG: SDR family oxidoreductase [Prevotellaceae bacterium]|jgi:NADP-dependent 3-hydroxy acid dehydrogenase YdfG|nr:SDR family oxidoreductase [Prevotellaceae bacterium]